MPAETVSRALIDHAREAANATRDLRIGGLLMDLADHIEALSAARADGPGGGEPVARAAELLTAAARFIHVNHLESYEVYYDDAVCDGECLRQEMAALALDLEGSLSPVMVEGGLGLSGADIAPAASSGPVTTAEQAGGGE